MSIFWPDNPDLNWKPGDRRIRMTLTEFLLARIAEDEEVAAYAASLAADVIGYDTGAMGEGYADAGPYDPARALAECAAKRAIVEWHSVVENDLHEGSLDRKHLLLCSECTDVDPYSNQVAYPCRTLRTLALPYADHPDYDEAWRP